MTKAMTKLNARFDTVIPILMALVTVAGAVIAWRTSLVRPPGADRAGLNATLNAEVTDFVNDARLYRHYRAYTTYTLNHQLQYEIENNLSQATQEELPNLERQQAEATNTANISRAFFPSRYLGRDGSYDVQRELGEAWAQAGQKLDLNPEHHFARATRLRLKSSRLKAILIVLPMALLSFNLAKGLHPSRKFLRYAMAFGGLCCLTLAITAAIMVELLS